MAFKIISIICIGIVALEFIGVLLFFIAIALADDGRSIDNKDGKITCAETGEPCIYSEITPISCTNCPAGREAAADD